MKTMRGRSHWISLAIVALAFALRVAWLDLKPAHFDEGVNGWFVDQMTRQGFYHYDPTNFHGPLHFYALFLSQTLFGRGICVLRMPLVLASTACVAMALAFRAHLGERTCQLAALAMAVSPGMIFYGRDAIHEPWLVLFLMLTVWGLAGLWRFGGRGHLWAAALGVTGMILTKETYVIHCVALLLAAPCLLVFEKLSPSESFAFGGWKFRPRDVGVVAGVCIALIVFFYSGGLLHWPGAQTFDEQGNPIARGSVAGLWETHAAWFRTGTGRTSAGLAAPTGHEKERWYWLALLGRYEWPAFAGIAASVFLLLRNTNRFARYLAISGLGALIGYSIVPYKTPWCVISLAWPFYFVFGLAVVRAASVLDRGTSAAFAAVLCLCSLGSALTLNFRDFTDDREPYVYVQTFPDVNQLLAPLRALAASDPRNFALAGHFIGTEQHPFLWLLADFPRVDFLVPDALPESLNGDFFVVNNPLVADVEPRLHDDFFKLPMRIRGNSDDSATLYLRVKTFGEFVPAGTAKIEAVAPL